MLLYFDSVESSGKGFSRVLVVVFMHRIFISGIVLTLPLALGVACDSSPSSDDSCAGKKCSDSNECTSDVCTNGQCSNPAVADGAFCDGGNGACQSGVCASVAEPCIGKDCSDGSECTFDVCIDGNCSNPAAPNGTSCDAGAGRCQVGTCENPCAGKNCIDGNECTSDLCTSGQCSNPAVADGASCDGGDGACRRGVCEPLSGPCVGKDCSDGNECTLDVCTDGNCSNPPVANGTSCDGGAGSCQNGACQTTSDPCAGVDCSDGNECTDDVCANRVCSNPPFREGLSCGGEQGVCRGGQCKLAGTLDPDFDGDGIVAHDNAAGGSGYDRGYAITIDALGKILVAGSSWNDNSYSDMVIWKYHTDGRLDSSFDGDGIVVDDNAAGGDKSDAARAITIDASGRILVAGYSETSGSNFDLAIWRYHPGGSLDSSFDRDGIVVYHHPGAESLAGGSSDITVDAAGKILVASTWRNASGNWDMVICRYNPDGSLDSTFDGDGVVVDDNAAVGAMTLDASGRILVAGVNTNPLTGGSSAVAIWRYHADGSLDLSFDADGMVVQEYVPSKYCDARAITTDASGKILLAGSSRNASGNLDMAICRYHPDGSLDATFDGDGIVVHHNAAGGNGNDAGEAITLDAAGKILVAGTSDYFADTDMVIWRYKADGSLDESFDGDGIVVHHNAAGGNGYDAGEAITLDAAGKILVAGWSSNVDGNYDMVIWRYN